MDERVLKIQHDGKFYLLKMCNDETPDNPLHWESHWLEGKTGRRPLYALESKDLSVGDKDGLSLAWDLLRKQSQWDKTWEDEDALYYKGHRVPEKYIQDEASGWAVLTTGKRVEIDDDESGWHWGDNPDWIEQDMDGLINSLNRGIFKGLYHLEMDWNDRHYHYSFRGVMIWPEGVADTPAEDIPKVMKDMAKTYYQYFDGEVYGYKLWELTPEQFDLDAGHLEDLIRPHYGLEEKDSCWGFFGDCLESMLEQAGLAGAEVEDV